MSGDPQSPTEGAPSKTIGETGETTRRRPLGRELALEATLHDVFGLGDPPAPTIARYRIERRLGAGGMSEVFLAEDPKLRRRVAIKVLNHHFVAHEEQRLLREGWALASVKHPNVVAVHDVGVDRGRAFLVMEHVEGQTLDAWLAAAPRSLAAVLRLMIPICEGLARVHERGVVHRDLKPHNILVGADDRAKVIDFGLVVGDGRSEATPAPAAPAPEATALPRPGALTRDGALAGTPAYMSPEQACEQRELDGRSDLFSLAIVIYEAAFGARPFVGDGRWGVVDAIVGDPPRRPARAGVRARLLWPVLRRALAKRPEQRFKDMRAFGAALQRILERPRRVAIVTVIGIAVIGAALLGTFALPELRHRACRGPADEAWAGLEAVPQGLLRDRLERYRASWSTAWEGACAAAHRDGALTVDVGLPLRQTCLREAKGVALAAVGLLRSGDEEERARREAQLLGAELPSIAICEASPTARGRRPHEPGEDAAIVAIARLVREAEARFLVGEIAAAEELAREAVTLAAGARHRWSRARARITLGQILRRSEAPDPAATVELLIAGANEAFADHDPILAIRALHEAARGAVLLAQDARRGRELVDFAEAQLRALDELEPPLGPELWASQHDVRGLVAYAGDDAAAAVEAHREALRVLDAAAPLADEGRRLQASALHNLGRALGEGAGAKEAFDRAYAIEVELYGPDHPSLAPIRYSQAKVVLMAGDPHRARLLGEEALRLGSGAGPGATRQQARTELLLALIHHQRGEFSRALDFAIISAERFATLDESRGRLLLQARRLVAAIHRAQGHKKEADLAEALLVEQCTHDETLRWFDRVDVLLDRAKGQIDAGDPSEALRLMDALEDMSGEAGLPASGLAVRGWALAAAGRDADAISPLEEGIDRLTSGNQVAERARSQWILAEALIATDGERRRICDLLDSCRGFYAAPEQDPGTLASLDAIRTAQRCAPPTRREQEETTP